MKRVGRQRHWNCRSISSVSSRSRRYADGIVLAQIYWIVLFSPISVRAMIFVPLGFFIKLVVPALVERLL